jgi:hypothetical protein
MHGSLLETRHAGGDPVVAIRTWLNLVDGLGTQKTKVPIQQALFDTEEGADRPVLPIRG